MDRWNHVCNLVRRYGEQIQGAKKALVLSHPSEQVRIRQTIEYIQEQTVDYVKELTGLFDARRSQLENKRVLSAAEDKVRLKQELEDLIELYQNLLENLR